MLLVKRNAAGVPQWAVQFKGVDSSAADTTNEWCSQLAYNEIGGDNGIIVAIGLSNAATFTASRVVYEGSAVSAKSFTPPVATELMNGFYVAVDALNGKCE